MALLRCDIYSGALNMCTSVNVILPQEIKMLDKQKKYSFPVLYLLHGLSDDQNAWIRNTSIERYAAKHNIAVVMPTVYRGWYSDAVYGLRYWTYISEELPALVRSWFPVSRERRKTFVAGLSMGGYGAFKMAFRKPENFAAAASFSGALDMGRLVRERLQGENREAWVREFQGTFGNVKNGVGADNDLFKLAKKCAGRNVKLPRLYFHCGTEDVLCQDNHNFQKHLLKLGIKHVYDEGPGEHEWGLWDRQIQRALDWMISVRN